MGNRNGKRAAATNTTDPGSGLFQRLSRRGFLKASGATVATMALLAACDDDDDATGPPGNGVSLGTGNTAVLNYAYALEQLEAAFYIMAADNIFSGATQAEQDLIVALRAHEIAHREFFAAALAGDAIPDLEFDFGQVDFGSRESVLGTAQTFEDLGVSAYNGAGQLFSQDADGAALLGIAGKIVSVEARHAAAIRSIFQTDPRAFAGDDVVDGMGLDVANPPSTVLDAASDFILTEIDASGLPTS